ncbi:MAG TPA: PIG-L deacetylase family protein [Vampirovibrionales bacterium]
MSQNKLLSIVLTLFVCLSSGICNDAAFSKDLRIAVFAPHPDDEVIGCGGSIVNHIQDGNEVAVVYMTSGDSGNVLYSKEALADIREKEAKEGAAILGVNNLTFLRNPDGYLAVNTDNLVRVLSFLREFKPHIVYIPHIDEGHLDHKATNIIVSNAIGRSSGPWFQEVALPAWSVNTVLEYEVNPPMQEVEYCEDITDVIETKIKALEKHGSQIEDIKYHDGVKALNKYRGAISSGYEYAECFKVKSIKKLP